MWENIKPILQYLPVVTYELPWREQEQQISEVHKLKAMWKDNKRLGPLDYSAINFPIKKRINAGLFIDQSRTLIKDLEECERVAI